MLSSERSAKAARGAAILSALCLLVGCTQDGNPRTSKQAFASVVETTWSKTDVRMSTARFRHTATLLPDGKVLLVGGAVQLGALGVALGSAPTASAELFDPVTGRFKDLAGQLVHARWGHTATLLRDGRVLIAGGVDEADAIVASAELYDPASERFVETGVMAQPRALQTATLLPDDRVLFVGGINAVKPFYGVPIGGGRYVTTPARSPNQAAAIALELEAYQPQTGRFDDLGSAVKFDDNGSIARMPDPDLSQAAVLLNDGRVAIAWTQYPTLEVRQGTVTVLYFDPKANTLKAAGQVNCQSSSACLDILLHYEAGPAGEEPSSIDVVTRLNEIQLVPKTRAWVSKPHQPEVLGPDTAPAFNVMTFEPSQGPLLVGRWSSGFQSSYQETLAWRAATRDWSSSSLLAVPRAWPTATTLVSGSILVAGGLASSPLSSAEQNIAEVATSEIKYLGDATGDARATLLADGRVLFTGGAIAATSAWAWSVPRGLSLDATIQKYAPRDLQMVGTILAQRSAHQGFLLPSGDVLLAGGTTVPEASNEELFNPVSGESRDLGFRLQARGSGLALGGNRFLFAGEAGLQLVDADAFDRPPLTVPRSLGCAVPGLARMLNGHVAVVGQSSLFELDLEEETLSTGVALRTPRCDVALTALPDGSLAIAGGSAKDDQEAASTALEIYQPTTHTLSSRELDVGVLSAHPLVRFSSLLLLGQDTQSLLNWTSNKELPVSVDASVSRQQRGVTSLADGGILRTSRAHDLANNKSNRVERLDLMPTDSTALDMSGPPLEVSPGQDLDLNGLALSKTWPENSGGSTQGSATNTPIAIWIPILDGWAVTGTFTAWSEDRVTWHVPHPAFPGLGVLGYVLSGTLHPLRLVRINELVDSGVCVTSSECASGHCVDGVCCDRACQGACEACTAAAKSGGDDGVCGPTPADRLDDLCAHQDVKTCGTTGVCDGSGSCAVYPEGEPCAQGATCQASVAPDGTSTALCAPNESCSRSDDCTEGKVCDDKHKCAPPFGKPRTSIGCTPGCRLARRESEPSELWAIGLGLMLAASRRRARRCRPTSLFGP